jgi:oligoendopeptidase F
MGLNTQGLKDTTATTNIAIKTAYAGLDMKADKLEKRLKALLKKLLKVVLAEINTATKKNYQLKDVEFYFERTVMTNETENIQNAKTEAETKQIKINTILNVAVNVGDEQTLKAICDVMDWDYEELKGQVEQMQAEQEAAKAKAMLEDAVTDDDEPEPTPPEEPVEE